MPKLDSTENKGVRPPELAQGEPVGTGGEGFAQGQAAGRPSNGNLHLTSGRLLARNTVWNLIGYVAPLAVAAFCIPVLIRELGKDRFGVLALGWALIGYASLFDMGLGRALTQLVAQKLGAGEDHEIPALAWTSLLLMLVLGVVGTVAVVAISPWLVHDALKIPEALQAETVRAFYLLGFSIPVVITSTGLRGLLEAHQRFDLVGYLRTLLGVLTFLGPVLVLPFSRSLVPVMAALVAGRFAVCIASFWLCLKVVPELRHRVAWHGPSVGPLVRFGGWMTVSNVVSPLMSTMDRFLIGAQVSMAAVAYYATPSEVITKLLIVPASLVGVMFPAFSASYGRDRARAAGLYARSIKYVFLILFPVVLLVVGFARPGLSLWLGADFAQHSFRVLQWLALGVLMNGLACVPFGLVQGAGRPDLTAKLHLIELPCYLLALWWLVSWYGIVGAAIAWTARVSADCILLFVVARRLLPESSVGVLRVLGGFAAAVSILAVAVLPVPVWQELVVLLAALVGFGVATWQFFLTPPEKAFLWNRNRSSLSADSAGLSHGGVRVSPNAR